MFRMLCSVKMRLTLKGEHGVDSLNIGEGSKIVDTVELTVSRKNVATFLHDASWIER